MNKDGCHTYIHMQRSRDADLFEDFCCSTTTAAASSIATTSLSGSGGGTVGGGGGGRLPDDDIYVAPQHQPINPEDEDDVVPDQHAAFGIQKATQRAREPAWRDLALADLMHRGPALVVGRQRRGGGLEAAAGEGEGEGEGIRPLRPRVEAEAEAKVPAVLVGVEAVVRQHAPALPPPRRARRPSSAPGVLLESWPAARAICLGEARFAVRLT